MEKQPVLYGIMGLLLGVIITWTVAVSAVNSQSSDMMRMMGMKESTGTTSTLPGMNHDMGMMDSATDMSSMSMGEMTNELKGVTGDEFDKKFLASMIAHHQGAIDMANAANNQAKHQEIKDMASDIISAQTSEITKMKDWQKEWGY